MTDTRTYYDESYPPSLWAEPEVLVMAAKAPKKAKASATPEAPEAPPDDEPPPDEPPAED